MRSLEELSLHFHVGTVVLFNFTFNRDSPSINLQCAASPTGERKR